MKFLRNNHKEKPQSVEVLENLYVKDSRYWMNHREVQSLKLFHDASERIPAYKDYLAKNKINSQNIKTWEDFQKIPTMSKKTYLRNYDLAKLCWDGSKNKPLVFTATSGSTGEPFYFVREQQLDWQYSVMIEDFLNKRNPKTTGPVLVIICFGMGLWIGGLITYKAFELASIRSGFPVSIITPGFNKNEIFNALKVLSPQYNQTILAGYPPLLKDIIDEAPHHKINLKKLDIRMLFAAEAVTENFRTYIAKKAGIKNLHSDFMSIYGSADIGAMAQETNISILIRRLAQKNKKLFNDVFSPINKTPTLAQFNPEFINFESVNGQLLLTGNSAIPLIRYAIGDNGGVFSFEELETKMKNHNVDLAKEVKKAGIENQYSKLPFVYVYERTDLSTSYYGLLIFPEWIRDALIKPPLTGFLTGKFTMTTKHDKEQNQFLEINLELHKGVDIPESMKEVILKRLVASLKSHSSEYREILNGLKEKAYPVLEFWKAEDPTHFRPGIKQKWVKTES